MKPSAVAAALGIAESTVRKYAQKYSEFLTPGGAGGEHKHRDFAEHDVRVLKLIRDMSVASTSPDDVDVTLQSLKSNGWDRLPALDESAKGLVASPGALVAANADKGVMQREIELLREQMDILKADGKDERDQLNAQINDLGRKLSRAETLLELYESGRLKPKEE
ncbi:MAG: MerR family transcriptional regulator [Chloroflexota bacterium]